MRLPSLGSSQRKKTTVRTEQTDCIGTEKEEARHRILEGARKIQAPIHAAEPENAGRNAADDG